MFRSWMKQLAALFALVFINVNFIMYFYRRSHLSNQPIKTIQGSGDLQTRIFTDVNSDLNHTKFIEFKNVVSNSHKNQSGYLSHSEYKDLLQNIPRDPKRVQALLGLVLDEANQTKENTDAFRKLLHMANSTSVQSRYAKYPMEFPVPENQNSKKAQNYQTLRKLPQKREQIQNTQPEADVIPRDIDRLSFEPIGESYGASFFNMFHAREPKYFTNFTPTIPHIIHQTWDSYSIPGIFKPWIKSMVDKHPNWEYWFWTPKDVECLLRMRYPQKYLDTYKKYRAMIFKTDFLRYFLLYEFGGFYVDLDVEALHPLDFWTYKHQCVMSHENYEHAYLLHNRKLPNVMTTIIGTRPGHPYFKMLQENLAAYQRRFARDVLHATGPFYLNDIFTKYMSTNTSEIAENSITVIHPRYWLPKFDYRLASKIKLGCSKGPSRLTAHGREVCRLLARKNFQNRLSSDSFLDHHWTHVNTWKGRQKNKDTFNLFDLIPNAIKASDKLKCSVIPL